MDYINKKTGEIATEQGFGFYIDFGDGTGMLMPGQFIRGNPEWEPLPKIGDNIKDIIEKKEK